MYRTNVLREWQGKPCPSKGTLPPRLKRKPSAVAESETMQERWTSRSVCVCVCVMGRMPRMQGSNAPTAASTPQVLETA